MRNQNISIHQLWKFEGKPRSGATNCERLRVRATYRQAIKHAQRAPKQASWNKLHTTLAEKSTTNFWKSWKLLYSNNQSHLHSVVNGVTGKEEIADSFNNHFVTVSQPNNQQRVDEMNEQFHAEFEKAKESHVNCNCSDYSISLENILNATFSLKKGKCFDDSNISAEHFFNAPLTLFDRVMSLLQSMLRHEHVPIQFQCGTIVPIIKDRNGDHDDMNNYRGITIAPVASKIFEHSLHIVFQAFLTTSEYQSKRNPLLCMPYYASKKL